MNANEREYLFKGPRLGLSLATPGDARMHYELWQDPVVHRNYNSRPPAEAFEEWLRWYNDPSRQAKLLTTTIVLLPEERPIGVISLRDDGSAADVSIILQQDWRGEGYGTEAVGLMAEYTFRREGFQRLTAGAYEFNAESIRMLEKVGFVRDSDQDEEEEDAWHGGKTVQLGFQLDRASWERSKL